MEVCSYFSSRNSAARFCSISESTGPASKPSRAYSQGRILARAGEQQPVMNDLRQPPTRDAPHVGMARSQVMQRIDDALLALPSYRQQNHSCIVTHISPLRGPLIMINSDLSPRKCWTVHALWTHLPATSCGDRRANGP